MFITNNHASFHLWWTENLLIYQNVSKYYEHGCLQNFLSLSMSFLTAFIVKNSYILARVYFIFLKKHRLLNLKGFQYQIWTSVKRLGKYFPSKTNFSTFLHISCPILSWNCVKGLRVPNFDKKIKFEGIWGRVGSKKLFAETTTHKILETNSSFYVEQRTTGKVKFLFSVVFC